MEATGMAKKKYLRLRGMVTLFLLCALCVDAASGIILFLSPAGSIARRSSWAVWGLNKGQWESIHIVFSLVLLLILAGHLYFNWRMLTHFLWDKMRQIVTLKKELAGAFAMTVLLLIGTLWNVQPLSAITDLRETMKRSGNAGFLSGQGSGYGRNSLNGQHQNQIPGSIDQNHFQRQSSGQQRRAGSGDGFGRNASPQTLGSGIVYAGTSQLKGRDYVRLGKLETHTGVFVKLNDEWGLKTGDRVFEIHMGPAEYRAYKGFTVKEGENAKVSGFVYNNNLSVTIMESGGQFITLRDETGRPAWAGSDFSRGGGQDGVFSKNGDS